MKEWIIRNFSLVWNNISNINSLISIIIYITSIGTFAWGLVVCFLRLKLKHNRYKYLDIPIDHETKQSMKYYIATRGQEIDPCTESNNAREISFDLTSFFLKEIFRKSDEQYFIILADSGMGKTTFLLKLFLEYYKKILRKKSIILVPLAFENAIDRINKIVNKSTTILLLDGFDEDIYAMNDYIKRLKEICNATESFYKVIITCRTQFFSDSKSEPLHTDKIRFGVGKKSIEFKKYYISPFNEKEISLYLKKKYNFFFKKNKLKNAQKIIDHCPDLMMRPMLLRYIDDLFENEAKLYTTTYEIYEELVFKWIDRETVDNEVLYDFSKSIAEHMYSNKTVYISQDDIKKLCVKYNIKIKDIEAKSKSLLNRNVNGDYKFAHKSILEYFVTNLIYDKWTIHNPVQWDEVDKYEMVKLFLKEKSFIELTKRLQNSELILENTLFAFCVSHNANFSKMNISKCEFKDCDFTGSDFSGVIFSEVKFNHVNLRKANFERANLIDIDLRRLDLEEAIMEEAYLSGVNLRKVNLHRVNLRGANLEGANLSDANLEEADLSNADLKEVDLRGADLNQAVLNDANLEGADLRYALLNHTYPERINLKRTILDGYQVAYLRRIFNISESKIYDAEIDEIVEFKEYYEKKK